MLFTDITIAGMLVSATVTPLRGLLRSALMSVCAELCSRPKCSSQPGRHTPATEEMPYPHTHAYTVYTQRGNF